MYLFYYHASIIVQSFVEEFAEKILEMLKANRIFETNFA